MRGVVTLKHGGKIKVNNVANGDLSFAHALSMIAGMMHSNGAI